MESPREKFSAERGGLAVTEAERSDEALQLDCGTSDASPSAQEKRADGKMKVGKWLESIGDSTVNALQRIASAVGGVAKAPAVVMANVGSGLGSNANSPTSSRETPLLERVSCLEMQMAMLEEKYNSKALATEFNLSPRSHPTTPRSTEKLRTARSLLQETERKGTLVERVQFLEDRLTEHMESTEKALSSIQSKLAHIDTGKLKPESLAVQDAGELQESPSGEEFHDADQGSGNLESLETLEQKSVEEDGVSSDVPGEASGTSPTPQEALVEEPLAGAPTAEPAPEDSADKSSTVLPSSEPQLASSVEEPLAAAPAKEPSAAVPSAKFSESAEDASDRSGIAVAAATSDSPLTSIAEKPQEPLVKEPLAAAPTAEPAPEDSADESSTVLPPSEPQLASSVEEPLAAAPTAEPAPEDSADESSTVLPPSEPQLASSVEEPLAAAPTAEPAPEDSADESSTVLPPSEPQLASSVEEPQDALAKESSAAVPSAKFSESAEDASDRSGVAVAAATSDSPLTSIAEKPQEPLVKKPLAAAPTAEPAERAQGDDAGKNDTVLSSSEPQLASTLEEPQGDLTKERLIAEAHAKLEEPAAQEDAAVLAGAELPLTSTVEEPQNGTVGSVTEDKHAQKESEYKAAEDVEVPAGKPEAFASSVMEPKQFGHREKKKKEKKEKMQDGVAEQKHKKHSWRTEEKRQDEVAEEERRNSLRAEGKNKQHFKHLRDRFKRAFSSWDS